MQRKDLLGIAGLSAEEITEILDRSAEMKEILLSGSRKSPILSGKTVLTLFYENSTRTRMSFELASKYLGANAANVTVASSSVQKGETLADTGLNLEAMGTDCFVIRHSAAGAPHLLAKTLSASVINAGDGMNEHPTQALLDLCTIREVKGGFEGLKVAIIGDVAHSRVARSNIYGLKKLGARPFVAAPATLLPPGFDRLGAEIRETPDEAADGADVIICLRIQLERQKSGLFPSVREYSSLFGVCRKTLSFAKPDAVLMHPGPVNWGVELSSDVKDCRRNLIIGQVTNGVAVRMALLDLLINRKG